MERWILNIYFWFEFFLLLEIKSRQVVSRRGKNSRREIFAGEWRMRGGESVVGES